MTSDALSSLGGMMVAIAYLSHPTYVFALCSGFHGTIMNFWSIFPMETCFSNACVHTIPSR